MENLLSIISQKPKANTATSLGPPQESYLIWSVLFVKTLLFIQIN